MADSTITFIVLGVVVLFFVANRIPVAVIAVGTSLALWATGVLELEEATAGFGDPTVLFIAALFVVSDSLESTGVTAWVGQQLLDRGGSGRARLVVFIAGVCALLTAFITPNASVAALVPVVVLVAMRTGRQASQLLIPLAFSAHAGSLLALTGSPVSVVVSDAADEAGAGRFGFFEFALVGIPLLIGTVAIMVLLGPRLLPERTPERAGRDLSQLESTLRKQYRIDGESIQTLLGRRHGVSEVVIPPRSHLIGEPYRPGMATESGTLTVIAVLRNGEVLGEVDSTLRAGDVLLVRGTWKALATQIAADDQVLAVDQPDAVRRQTVPLGVGAIEALVVLAAMVISLAAGLVPPAVAALVAAGALILLGVVTIEQAYRAVGWTTVVLVAGMLPLSTAMRTTGAAEQLASRLVDLVGDSGPYPLIIGLFVLAAVLGQLISNMATALIVIPIALSAAAELDVAVSPVLMSLNIACAAALLTPIATPANLMVMEPGGYRFGDYWRLGAVIMAWYFAVAIVYVPWIWSF